MKFNQTKLKGVFEIEIEPHADERGFFARSWCQTEFEQHGINPRLVQCNISYNYRKGTLRGMHFQAEPYPEAKLVRCTRGGVYDVVLDLRRDSPTFKDWIGVELTANESNAIYVPAGCGHGFITLEDGVEVAYQMSEVYHSDLACGVRWDDPQFGVQWPLAVEVISERDRTYPDFQ